MKAKANFDYEIDRVRKTLVIFENYNDANPTRTVTNDIENVLSDIEDRETIEITKQWIILAQDTDGVFDRVKATTYDCVQFIYVGAEDMTDVQNYISKVQA